MKSTPSELISTFRKKISFTSALGIILSILGLVLLFFLELVILLEDNVSPITGICIVSIFYFWERNITYMEILKSTPEEVLLKLETYIEKESNRNKKHHWTRIFILTAIALVWIILIITHPKSEWTSFLFLLWIACILFFVLTRWFRMKEEFMLQDLKHTMRELIHETPEMPAGQ